VPQTYWEDNDPLDVIVLTTFPLFPGVLVRVRPIAVMEMIDDGESDFKLVAVPSKDKRWEFAKDLTDLNSHTLKEYQHFFETYKALKGDVVEIHGFKGRADAIATVQKAVELYKEKFKK